MEHSRTIGDYELIKQLGKGSFGSVYLAINPEGKKIALKVINIPYNSQKLLEQTKKELEYLKILSQPECNPYVICYYDSYYDGDNEQFLIEMEYIEGLELNKYISELRKTESNEKLYYYILLIAKAISEGLKYSHDKGILHNDIKPDNIMIDKNNVPRIIDYGLACILDGRNGDEYCVSSGGSPSFLPPEYITQKNKRYPASDMWALGVSLYEVVTGEKPYDMRGIKNVNQMFHAIIDQNPMKLNTDNELLNKIVNGLLVKNIKERLTAQQVIDMLSDTPVSQNIDNSSEITYSSLSNMNMDISSENRSSENRSNDRYDYRYDDRKNPIVYSSSDNDISVESYGSSGGVKPMNTKSTLLSLLLQ